MRSPGQKHDSPLLPPADLAGELDSLRGDLRTERDRTLRALADFTNYRRRTERDGNTLAEAGKRAIILPLLDIIDDIEKALPWGSEDNGPFVQGVRNIHHKLLALLATHGVLPFDSVGMPFDHNLHEAVAMATHKGGAPGTVLDELRSGYLWNGALLRSAQVRVAG